MRTLLGIILLLTGLSVEAKESSCGLLSAISIQNPPAKLKDKIDFILVGKSQRRLIVFSKGEPIKEYSIQLGFNPVGHKEQDGDGKTPEGIYSVHYRKIPSDYRMSLMLDYPQKKDIENAKRLGVKPGGDIAIHGYPNNTKELIETLPKIREGKDWTKGCVAISNNEIEEIFPLVAKKTPVEICP